jgi:ketosteroid isomerase-like protein
MGEATGAAAPVLALCRAMSARDFDGVGEHLAPDATWTIVGRPDRFAFGGPQTRPQFLDGLRASLPGFERFRFDVLAWAQNGDVVFVEAVAEGQGPGAARYSNRYLMRFTIRDGLIAEVLEHYDPFEALAYVEQVTG